MDSDSKRRKTSEEEEDRISNLPSSLISHILSLLPTKYAVRTSTLSTFWNRQWTSITKLRFDDALAPDTSSTPETKASFVNFVYRVLLHLKVASPNVFQLNCTQDYRVTDVNSWVSAALSRNVQHIDLTLSKVKQGLLPSCLFSSRNLVVLKLGTGFRLKVPMLISLDSLKILHLAVRFSDNDSLSRLVSSCPVLEELDMQGRIGHNVTKVEISSIALKRLILIGLDPRSQSQRNYFRIVLNTPGLQYLKHIDCRFPDGYSIEILNCLDRAHVDLALRLGMWPTVQESVVQYIRVGNTIKSLVVGISSVKSLHFSRGACAALHNVFGGTHFGKLPNFPRLVELEMNTAEWGFLMTFLESSPELATLSFQYSYHHNDRQYTDWASFQASCSVPLCLLANLKKVEIKNFRGEQMELFITRYFLEKSKCLNELLISYPSDITKEKEAEISKKLLKLPRASTSCVIVIT